MKNSIYNSDISYITYKNNFSIPNQTNHRKTLVNFTKDTNKICELSILSKDISFSLINSLFPKKNIKKITDSYLNNKEYEEKKETTKSDESSSDNDIYIDDDTYLDDVVNINNVVNLDDAGNITKILDDAGNITKIDEKETEEEFWVNISEIKCYDKDEKKMTQSEFLKMILKKNTTHGIQYYKSWMDDIFIPRLKEKIIYINLMDFIEPSNLDDILAHIIFKGKEFYNTILQNPDVCLYLVNQYYPIYSWISN